MAHVVTLETGCPVPEVGVLEGYVVLGDSQVWGGRKLWGITNVEVGRKSGTFIPERIKELVYLENSSSQA